MRTLDELGVSPAPWEVLNWRMFPNKICVAAEGGWVVADVQVDQYGCCSTLGDRNARLIAAAPMLYEALREIMTCWGDSVFDEGGMMCEIEESSHCGRCDPKGCPIYRKAKAALAAASGESEVAK